MRAFLKYLDGGDLSSFLVDYEPFLGVNRQSLLLLAVTSSTSQLSEGSSNSKKNDVGLTDLIQLVHLIKGLPIEISAISQKAYNMFLNMLIMNDGKINTEDLITAYFSLLGDIGQTEFNRKLYDKAQELAIANESIDDIAIDRRGRVYVQNLTNGEIKPVSLKEYANLLKTEDYIALTNSNLLHIGANDPHFAFNNGEIFNIVQSSVGMDKINDYILKISEKIGTSQLQQEGYSKKKAEQITSGFEQLTAAQLKGMTVDGLYKLSLISKEQYSEARMALDYLWATMPSNMKNRLRLTSALLGNDDVDRGAYNLIATLIQSGLNSTQELQQTITQDPNDKTTSSTTSSGSSGSGGSSGNDYGGKDDKTDPYTNMIKMMGATEIPIVILKGNVVMSFTGKNYPELVDISGKPVEETSVADLLTRGLGTIVTDKNAIVFGNQVVTAELLSNIMYDNSGGTMIIFPCKKDANGRTIINTDILDEYELAMKELSEINNPTELQEAEIYTNHGLMSLVDLKTGLPDRSKFAQFLVIDGYAVNKNDFLKPSSFLRELHNPSDDTIKRITKALSQGDNKEGKYDWDPSDKWALEFGSDEIYKGVLYIPITNNELQSKTAFLKTVKEPYSYEGDYLLMLKRIGAQSADGDILGINPGKISSN